jgi:hypothetical protein
MTKGARDRGFTLIELIVFIIVAGIFIPMAYIAFMAVTRGLLDPESVVNARFLAETKMEDLTGMTYASIVTPQASYVNVTSDPRFGSPPMPSPNPYSGYQWRWTIQSVAYQGRTTHGIPAISIPENWLPSTIYRVGDYVKPTQPSVHFYRCVSLASNPMASSPPSRWQANTSYSTNFYISPTIPNNLSYRCAARSLADFLQWQPNRPYVLGDYVVPTAPNGHSYRCTGAGTSGAVEPSPWPTAGSLVDGTVTWTENTDTRTTGGTEPSPWPTNPGDTVNDGSVTWATETLHTGSMGMEPTWPASGSVPDGSLCWQESTAYNHITVYVREPKGYEYSVNTIVSARPGAYP